MTKMIIKESEIRNYVRSLIREAMEVEAAKDPEDIAEREKMLAGKQYDRSKFPKGGQSLKMEREYRAKMGFPPLKKPHGGVIPRIIGADGSDLTPENTPDGIQRELEKRVQHHRDDRRIAHTPLNVQSDPVAQEITKIDWENLTPAERKAESERIRYMRVHQNDEKNAEIARQISDRARNGGGLASRAELAQRIQQLKDRIAELSVNDLNQTKVDNLKYVLKDTERIYRERFLDGKVGKDDTDDIVKQALADSSLGDAANADMEGQFKNDLINPDDFEKNKGKEEQDRVEPLDDRRGSKSRDFDEFKDFFGDDDDIMF